MHDGMQVPEEHRGSRAIPFARHQYRVWVRAERPSTLPDPTIRILDSSTLLVSTGFTTETRTNYLMACSLIAPSGSPLLAQGDEAIGEQFATRVETQRSRPHDEVAYISDWLKQRYGNHVTIEVTAMKPRQDGAHDFPHFHIAEGDPSAS
jgi:hypothetical protein